MINEIIHGDCLIESDKIPSGSVDLILTDLPYGNMKGMSAESIKTNNTEGYVAGGGYKKGYSWDTVIDPKRIYEIANRILRKNGKMVLFAQQPFTTQLINDAIPNVPHSYNMIWEKNDFANCLIAKKAPVSYYEDLVIFSKSNEAIHPHFDYVGVHPLRHYFKAVMDYIGLNLKQINQTLGHRRAEHTFYVSSTQFLLCTEKTYEELIKVFKVNEMDGFTEYRELKRVDNEIKCSKEEERVEYLKAHNKKYPSVFNLWEGGKYKSNIIRYKKDYNGYHPTQKPILLLEDLIRTFSNEGDTVVDLTAGSGSTLVAAINTSRNYIGIEQDASYVEIARKRITDTKGAVE